MTGSSLALPSPMRLRDCREKHSTARVLHSSPVKPSFRCLKNTPKFPFFLPQKKENIKKKQYSSPMKKKNLLWKSKISKLILKQPKKSNQSLRKWGEEDMSQFLCFCWRSLLLRKKEKNIASKMKPRSYQFYCFYLRQLLLCF